MMPRGALIATIASVGLAACAPQEFVWDDIGPARLAEYRAAFLADVGDAFTASIAVADLTAHLRGERILWLGDHHRSRRLHHLQMALLARLQTAGVRLAFALEAIGIQDETAVAAFVAGRTSMDELRAALRARWPGSWLDDADLDAPHYRALLQFARDHGLPVAALEPTPRLPIEARDATIPRTVQRLADRWPDRLLVVQLGQMHLAGLGEVVARAARSGLVIGGEPPPALPSVPDTVAAAGLLLQSGGGLWWFAELLASRNRDYVAAADRFAAWPRMSSDATR